MDYKEYKNFKVWAVIGSVHDKSKYANKIYHYMKNKGYEVYGIDPAGIDVDGEKTFKSISELPRFPEALDMVINPVKGKVYIDEAKKLGIRNVWFQPGAENPEIIRTAVGYGMNVVQNKCVMVDLNE